MITLTKEQIFILHKCIYDRYGGSYGLRDEGLLDSALMAPFQTFGGQDLYPEDKDKIDDMFTCFDKKVEVPVKEALD